MANNILFIFEGNSTEDIIVKSLEKHFLKEHIPGDTIIKCAFEAEIYQLYRTIQEEPEFDIFNLIKSRNPSNWNILKDYNRTNFAEIYLFFDYDGHSSLNSKFQNSGDSILLDMLSFFDNETEMGKLYISYPMVESLRHIIDFSTFYELEVKCKGLNCENIKSCIEKKDCIDEQNYKERVSKESIPQLCNINGYSNSIWKQLIKTHILKMNFIINNCYEYPKDLESQFNIFLKQIEKHIDSPCPHVSVLCAFPIFIHDYFGNPKTKELIEIE